MKVIKINKKMKCFFFLLILTTSCNQNQISEVKEKKELQTKLYLDFVETIFSESKKGIGENTYVLDSLLELSETEIKSIIDSLKIPSNSIYSNNINFEAKLHSSKISLISSDTIERVRICSNNYSVYDISFNSIDSSKYSKCIILETIYVPVIFPKEELGFVKIIGGCPFPCGAYLIYRYHSKKWEYIKSIVIPF